MEHSNLVLMLMCVMVCLCFKGLEDHNRSPSTYEVIMIDDRVVSRCAIHRQRAEIW